MEVCQAGTSVSSVTIAYSIHTTCKMRSLLVWEVTQHTLAVCYRFFTGQPISPILKRQAVQEETSLTNNQPTLYNIPEE